jgi:hypothetical protein
MDDGPDSRSLAPLPHPLQGRLDQRIDPEILLAAIGELIGVEVETDRFEVRWRASGLARPGAIAQLSWPRHATRIGLGIEPPMAHAIVDRLLGHDRPAAEGRLQVTPVEWGILAFVLARGLERLERMPGSFGPWDLTLDRVGPEPFDPSDLGAMVTWRWRLKLGEASAPLRLWLPESLLEGWLEEGPSLPVGDAQTGEWVAEAGTIAMPRGLSRLKPGSLLLIEGSPLSGVPESPEGPIELVLERSGERSAFLARAVPGSRAGRLVLQSTLRRRDSTLGAGACPSDDSPTTLTVELGRIGLPSDLLAHLGPDDELDLARLAREYVTLSHGGRVVARGELVPVDTELGVRVLRIVP